MNSYAGDFPLWIAPKQVIILPVSDKFIDYSKEIFKKMNGNNIRVELDLRTEKVGAKIRDAELNKIPYMVIVGEKEVDSQTLSVRKRFKGNLGEVEVDSFITDIVKEIKCKGVYNS